jgi:DNA-binding MarR family transcriptional regulator
MLTNMSPTLAARTELSSGLRISVMRLARRLRSERADHGLTLGQVSMLAALDRHGPLSPREIAALEGIRPPSATRTIVALTDQGLVTRTPHASDGRQVVIALTPAARALLREDRRRRDAWLATALESLPDDERAVLMAAAPILDRLAGA